MGATAGVLLPGQGDEAIAAEPRLTSPLLTADSLDAPQVLTIDAEAEAEAELSAAVEPEVIAAIATPAIGPSLIKHRIEDGDTLWGLSQSYGVSAEAIAASNSMNTHTVLTVGQTLKIPTTVALQTSAREPAVLAAEPQVTEQPTIAATPEPAAPAPNAEPTVVAASPAWQEATAQAREVARDALVYQVRSGDTLEAIARRFGSSSVELAQVNNLSNPNRLQPGQRLKVPTVDSSSTPVPAQVTPARPGAPSQSVVREEAEERTVAVRPQSNSSHIDRLRDDVMQMREQIRNERISNNSSTPTPEGVVSSAPEPAPQVARRPSAPVLLNPTPLPSQRVERPAAPALPSEATRPGQPEQPRTIAAAPAPTDAYNRLLQLPSGRTVAPELPPLQGPEHYLPERPQQFNGYIWPARGTLTSGYGPRWGRMHRGIDIAAPTGTPIYAAAAGVVIVSGWNNGGYGNMVDIRHPDGSVTRYAHHSRNLVRVGQRVEQGEQIALMGSTGFSTGPHLHFEIHPAGRGAVNPMAFLPRSR